MFLALFCLKNLESDHLFESIFRWTATKLTMNWTGSRAEFSSVHFLVHWKHFHRCRLTAKINRRRLSVRQLVDRTGHCIKRNLRFHFRMVVDYASALMSVDLMSWMFSLLGEVLMQISNRSRLIHVESVVGYHMILRFHVMLDERLNNFLNRIN